MKISLITVGKTDEDYLRKGIDKFVNRLKHYIGFELIVIPDIKNSRNMSITQQKAKEGLLILENIRAGADVVLLDEKGKSFTSINFAKFIEKKSIAGTRYLYFVIGGPYGFSDEVYKKITNKISLSDLTFSHQMIRLLFVEQLYRAFTIIKNEPYHHQ